MHVCLEERLLAKQKVGKCLKPRQIAARSQYPADREDKKKKKKKKKKETGCVWTCVCMWCDESKARGPRCLTTHKHRHTDTGRHAHIGRERLYSLESVDDGPCSCAICGVQGGNRLLNTRKVTKDSSGNKFLLQSNNVLQAGKRGALPLKELVNALCVTLDCERMEVRVQHAHAKTHVGLFKGRKHRLNVLGGADLSQVVDGCRQQRGT